MKKHFFKLKIIYSIHTQYLPRALISMKGLQDHGWKRRSRFSIQVSAGQVFQQSKLPFFMMITFFLETWDYGLNRIEFVRIWSQNFCLLKHTVFITWLFLKPRTFHNMTLLWRILLFNPLQVLFPICNHSKKLAAFYNSQLHGVDKNKLYVLVPCIIEKVKTISHSRCLFNRRLEGYIGGVGPGRGRIYVLSDTS